MECSVPTSNYNENKTAIAKPLTIKSLHIEGEKKTLYFLNEKKQNYF